MRGGLLLETFHEGLRNILDGQGCHAGFLSNGSIMTPLWILSGLFRIGQARAYIPAKYRTREKAASTARGWAGENATPADLFLSIPFSPVPTYL
jgi:hypothetical protein